MKKYAIWIWIIVIVSCQRTVVQSIETTKTTEVYAAVALDSLLIDNYEINQIIQPYKDSIQSKLNKVIGKNINVLEKKLPENTIGYLVAESMLWRVDSLLDKPAVALVNHNGVRVPRWSQGNIDVKQCYETMPFDNTILIIEVNGNTLVETIQQLCKKNIVAIAGGSYTLNDTIVNNVYVHEKPIDKTAKYNVIISDYLANGGDNLQTLKSLTKKETQILVRNSIIDYISFFKSINITEDKRIKYAK